jgi:hypothetical protein
MIYMSSPKYAVTDAAAEIALLYGETVSKGIIKLGYDNKVLQTTVADLERQLEELKAKS